MDKSFQQFQKSFLVLCQNNSVCSAVESQVNDGADMEFVQNFTPPDFRAKNFTPSISPNFNSFSKKKHKK